MKTIYDRDHIREFYNSYADLETNRWDRSEVERCKLAVHRHYLDEYLTEGESVLELGAGTGIFTEQIAGYAETLIVTDLSPVQLEINQQRGAELGYGQSVSDWKLSDICDLSDFADASFDKVVCFGGPLSYVFEQKLVALAEMKRVLKPGGLVLLGVMNLWGSMDHHMENIVLEISEEDNEKILSTGNLHPSSFAPSDHHCHMFTKAELEADIKESGLELVVLSASNCLSSKRGHSLAELAKDEERMKFFLDLEVRACKSEGMQESGTHMIAVARKRVE